MAEYRYIFADLLTDTVRETLPLREVGYMRQVNGPGGFAAQVPLYLAQHATAVRPYFQTVLTDSPLGYYRLDEGSGSTANDSSGNSNDGTYIGTIGFRETGAIEGDVNRAIQMAAQGDGRVDLPSGAFNPAGGTYSVEIWFKTASAGAYSNDGILFGCVENGVDNFILHIDDATGYLQASGTNLTAELTGNTDLRGDDTWHHAAFVYDSDADHSYLYLDGALIDDGDGGELQADGSDLRAFGASWFAAPLNWWAGELDEAATYHSVLSATRIAAHYNAGIGDRETTSITFNRVTSSVLDKANTAIYIERDGVVVWGGILWSVEPTLETDTLLLGGQGFWSYFWRRVIRSTLTYSSTEQFDIAKGIIDHVQGIANGDIGVTISKSPSNSGITRDRTYESWHRKWAAEAVEELASVINGFDFELTAGGTFGSFTRTLHLWYPQRGRELPVTWRPGKNIQLLAAPEDGLMEANHVHAIGAGDGPTRLVAEVTDTTTGRALLESVTSHTDVTRDATLREHAFAELNRWKRGERTMTISLVDSRDTPVGSYIPGDWVRLDVDRGYLSLFELWRIMQFTVTPDDSGTESVEIELAPLEAFSA